MTEIEKVGQLKANLKSLGGTGKLEDGRSVYRRVTEQVVPLGIGLTETPAADVQGVAVQKEQEEEKQLREQRLAEEQRKRDEEMEQLRQQLEDQKADIGMWFLIFL